MTDLKISGLSELTSPTSSDEIEILDKSDSTYSSDGTNKRITLANLSSAVSAGTFSKVVATDNTGDYQTDGSDDDVQIQAAIDAVASAGGGTVYIREGTYTIGSEISFTEDYINIIGDGVGATILQMKAGFATDDYIIANLGADYFKLKHLTLDGNKANQTTENHSGLYTTGNDFIVDDVEAKNFNLDSGSDYGYGFDIQGYGNLINCNANNNDSAGYTLYEPSSAGRIQLIGCRADTNSYGFEAVEGAFLSGCNAYSNTNAGFHGNGGDECGIVGCISEGNGTDGILNEDSFKLIQGCYLYGNDNHGIQMSGSSNCTITGNFIDSAGVDTDNTYSGILLTGTSAYNVITGNRIDSLTGGSSYKYGIREASSNDDYNLINSNLITDAETTAVSTQGANSTSADNLTA